MTPLFYRFISKVVMPADEVADCWIWTGAKSRNGYGVIRNEKMRLEYAHRVSYTLHVGDIPARHVLMHSCDRRDCVNPHHVRPALQRANLNDMRAKGRHPLASGAVDWAKFWTHGIIARVD